MTPPKSRPSPTGESATARLSRLLTMVPWLLVRPGVDLEVAAAEFGVTPAQLVADLELLFLCGLPGGMPDDLIEADWEDGRVYLGNAEHIARPLRLTVDEALTLMVGLRALASTPGIAAHESVARALARLEEATGAVGEASARVHVSMDDGARESTLADARTAVSTHRRVHLRYLVPGRDEVSERDVDPMRVVSLDAKWYLEGWCHLAEDVRLFRLDRVEHLEVLPLDGTPPPQAQPRDLGAAVFTPHADDLEVVVETDRSGAWVADYYPTESVVELGEGRRRITLRVADPAWVRRLAWRMGGHVTVLSPPDLRASVAAGADAALTAYAESSPFRPSPATDEG
ncbi:MAG: WYL domain-containing protein [Actinomycetota bacterium]|nr:WYL domain-containing protein [Actinomycetota bacterium]